jgi:hypothetical protein
MNADEAIPDDGRSIGPRRVEATYLGGDRVVGRKTMVLDGEAVRRRAAEVVRPGKGQPIRERQEEGGP